MHMGEETIEDNTFLMVLKCQSETQDPVIKEACRLFIAYVINNEESDDT